MRKEIKVVLRKHGPDHLQPAYRIEKIVGQVSVTFRDTSDPNKPHDACGRVGDKISESAANDLVDRYSVETLAPAK